MISSAFASNATTPTPFGPNNPTNSSPFEAKFDDKFDYSINNFASSSSNSAFTSFPKTTLDSSADNKGRGQKDTKETFKPFRSSFNSNSVLSSNQSTRQNSNLTNSEAAFKPEDPFDADWVPPLESHNNQKNESSHYSRSTNPFIPSSGTVKTFQIQM